MGGIRELVRRKYSGAWEVDNKLLEEGFNLCTRNIGGSHSERLENQDGNRMRRWFAVIPDYCAEADPHLKKYYKGRKKVCGGGSVVPGSYIVSTAQVLELKRLFFHHAEGLVMDIGWAIFPFVFRKGVECVNNHRWLYKSSLIKPIQNDAKLRKTLQETLGFGPTLHWKDFLLLTTINLGSKKTLGTTTLLKKAHIHYTTHHPITSETAFMEMVLYINGGNRTTHLTTFYQQGDFYKSRGGLSSFPELVFSLYSREIQLYIMRARGRGDSLSVNFSGHRNVGGKVEKTRCDDNTSNTNGSGSWRGLQEHWKP